MEHLEEGAYQFEKEESPTLFCFIESVGKVGCLILIVNFIIVLVNPISGYGA